MSVNYWYLARDARIGKFNEKEQSQWSLSGKLLSYLLSYRTWHDYVLRLLGSNNTYLLPLNSYMDFFPLVISIQAQGRYLIEKWNKTFLHRCNSSYGICYLLCRALIEGYLDSIAKKMTDVKKNPNNIMLKVLNFRTFNLSTKKGNQCFHEYRWRANVHIFSNREISISGTRAPFPPYNNVKYSQLVVEVESIVCACNIGMELDGIVYRGGTSEFQYPHPLMLIKS